MILFSGLAQGTLEFNQVINLNLSGTTPTVSGSYTIQTINITVPAGKVWKIESATCRINSAGSLLIGGNSSQRSAILLDNNVIGVLNTSSAVLNTGNNFLPIWLKPGNYTVQLAVELVSIANTQTAYGFVSAIEFNVVP